MEENNNSWTARWQNKLQLSRDKHDYVMLTDGSYADTNDLDNGDTNPYWVGSFYNVKNHNGQFRQWRNSNDPESTLFIRNEEQDPRVSYPKNQFFFNIVHFDVYQKQEVRDKKGNIIEAKRGPNAGQPLMGWKVVNNLRERKAVIKNPDEEDSAFFRKKYLQVGPTHYDNLLTIIDKARELCHCSGHLEIANYECEHCGAHMLDMDNTDLTIEDVNRFGDGVKRCPHCRQRGYPIPVLECDSCDNPRPHRFDQVVAKLKKSGTGPQTVIQVDDVISALEFRLDDKSPILELDDKGSPIIEDNNFMLIEDLEYISNIEWDFDAGHPAPGNGEVSTFLGLQPEDEGYSNEASSYSKTKKSVARRRFR